MTRPRLLTRIVLGLVLCCGVAAAAQGFADRLVLGRVAAGLSSLPGVSAGSVTRDSETGRIVLRDLRIVREGGTIAVGRLALLEGTEVPSLVTPAAAEAGSIVADDLVVTGVRNRYRVPHLELRGTKLTGSDIAALLDPAGPQLPADRLAGLTAAVVTAPSATIEVNVPPSERPGLVVTVHDIALVDVVGGRVGAMTAQRVDVVGRGDTSKGTLSTGQVRADLLDLPLALRLAEAGRVDPGTALGSLVASASIASIELRQGDGNGRLTVAALRSGAVRARPLPTTIDTTSTLLQRKLDRLTPGERRTLVGGLADLADSYELDHAEIDGVHFDDGSPRRRKFSLGRMALDGIGARRSASLTLDGVAFDTPEATMTLDHAALWGLDPAAAIALARRAVELDGSGLSDWTITAGSARTAAALDRLRITAPSADGTGNSPDGSTIIVEVPEASAASEPAKTGDALTTSSHARLIFPLPPVLRDPNLQSLATFGLTRLDVTADETLSFDQAAQRFSVDDLSVGVAQIGSLAVKAAVGHVETRAALWDGSAEAGDRAASLVTLESFSIRFANAGLVEKSLPLLAASAGVSVPVFKASVKAQAAVSIAEALGDTPAAAQLNDALSAFLDDPHSIGLSIKAHAGLTLKAAQAADDPASLLRLVTIEASANR